MRPADQRLPDCPGSPNCVNSQDADPDHRVDPLVFGGAPALAWDRLREVLEATPHTKIIESDHSYMHVEIRSAVFRFVDDLQLLLDGSGGRIHVRSASRLGYSDMGTNRRHVEALRATWEAAMNGASDGAEGS